MTDQDRTALERRIAELEAENASLREATGGAASARPHPPGRRRGRGRTVASVALIVIGLLLAPIAVIGGWARLQLVDTDRFVATFGPLAEDPDVQAFLSDEITTAILTETDVEQVTGDLFDGIRSLDLPPRALDALSLLEGPAVAGVEQLIGTTVQRVVESPQFADIWSAALRFTHRNFVAAVQGDPDAAVQIGADGTLALQLGPIIEEVKQRLVDAGVGIASAIPAITASVTLVQNDAFVLVQTLYALAVAAGTWLPWVALAFLVAGVAVARRPLVTLAWTAAGFALSMLILASGFGIGRAFFLGTVSPSIMPRSAAESIYDGLVDFMVSTTVALLVLGVLVTLVAWFGGPSASAVRVRGAATAAFGAARAAADRRGIGTGRFGVALDRAHRAVVAGVIVVASLVVLLVRPIRVDTVIWTVVLALLAIALVELLRRPADEGGRAAVDASEVPLGEGSAGAGAASTAGPTSESAVEPGAHREPAEAGGIRSP